MINADGYCDHCKTWHRPDPKYWNDCPNPWVPLKRAPQPTPEERAAEAIRAIELKVVYEHAARRRDAERRDWQQTRQRSAIGEMLNDVHRRQSAELAAKVDEVTAELAAARAWRRGQARAVRLDRAVETRTRQQQAETRARGEALNRTLASQERRARERAGAIPVEARLTPEQREQVARFRQRLSGGSDE